MTVDSARVVYLKSAASSEDTPSVDSDPELSGPVIAKILGLTDRRVRQLAVEGMPRARWGLYPLMASVQWYIAYLKTTGSSRTKELKNRKLALEIEFLEFRVKKAKDEVVDKLEIVAVIGDGFRQLGREMDLLPRKLALEFGFPRPVELRVRDYLDNFRRNFADSCREYVEK